MKLLKKRGYTGTVRKIVTDDKTEVLGIVGTFEDLMDLGIVEQVTNYSWDTWCCIPGPGRIAPWNGIGAPREEALPKLHYRERLIQLDGGVNGDAVGHRHPTQRKYLGGSEQEPCYRLQDIGPGLSCPQFFHPFPQMLDSGCTKHDTQGSPHNQSGSGD